MGGSFGSRPFSFGPSDLVDEVLAIIKTEHVQHVGFVGNEAYLNM